MLKLHPPPFEGRDDDIVKVREVLNDLLRKTGYTQMPIQSIKDRIILAPDHKIAQHVFSLRKKSILFRKAFVLEFPLLHLTKSTIVCLLSAYSSAGLSHLMTLMGTEDDDKAWQHLSCVTHITTAVKRITRLCVAFQLCLLLKFLEHLPTDSRDAAMTTLRDNDFSKLEMLQSEYDQFVSSGCDHDSVFRLHNDMLKHMLTVVGLSLAEKMGGVAGYVSRILLFCSPLSMPLRHMQFSKLSCSWKMQAVDPFTRTSRGNYFLIHLMKVVPM